MNGYHVSGHPMRCPAGLATRSLPQAGYPLRDASLGTLARQDATMVPPARARPAETIGVAQFPVRKHGDPDVHASPAFPR